MNDDAALLLEGTTLTSRALRNYLESVEEKRVFQNISGKSKLTGLISAINTELHASGDNRSKALLLLERLIMQCPADLFAENLDGWTQQCSRWNPISLDDELRILRQLIEKSVSIPGSKSHLTTHILRRFVERLTSVDKTQKSTQTAVNSLRCIRSFVHCYSSSCGNHRGVFQKYVMYCLTEHIPNEDVIHEAAACLIALCECGSKGPQGINFKNAWSAKFPVLVSTCHKILDSIYKDVDMVGLVSVEPVKEFLPELVETLFSPDITPVERYQLLAERFGVAAEVLRAALLCKYSTNKSFQPSIVFGLVSRALSVTGKILKTCVQTKDIIALTAVIPKLHERNFDIVEALITSAERNLISFGPLICKLCVQSLKWTDSKEWAYGSQKPFQSLRSKVYCVLSSWMSVAGPCSSIEMFADELIPIIVSDIEFAKPSVKLTVSTKPSKTRKSRKRGHMVTEMNMMTDSPILIERKANAKSCIAAHRALQSLLHSASVFIKWEHHKFLQCVILQLFCALFDSQSSKNYPLPYSDSECRQCLYASLMSLVQDPHPKWTAPLSLTVRFLTTGTCDDSMEVSSYCRTALNQIEPIIHPRCPTLYFPHEISDGSSNPKNSAPVAPDVPISKELVSEATNVEQPSRRQETESPHDHTVSDCDIRNVKRVRWSESVSASTESAEPVPVSSESDKIPVLDSIQKQPERSYEKAVTTAVQGGNEKSLETAKVAEPASGYSKVLESCRKRTRMASLCESDDERVSDMLNDFVDTWKD